MNSFTSRTRDRGASNGFDRRPNWWINHLNRFIRVWLNGVGTFVFIKFRTQPFSVNEPSVTKIPDYNIVFGTESIV